MRNTILLLLFLFTISVSGQTDSTKAARSVDSIKVAVPDSSKEIIKQQTNTQTKDSSVNQQSTAPQVAPKKKRKDRLPYDTTKVVYPFDVQKYNAIRSSPEEVKFSMLDNLTPEELLEYYLCEPQPPVTGLGAGKGDSLYKSLDRMTVPTNTVYGESLLREFVEPEAVDSAFSVSDQAMRPKIGFGVGRLGYHGDLGTKKFQSPLLGRPAIDLAISQRLTRYLQVDFSVLFGKIGANEQLSNRHENILTEVRAGGVNLIYDFGNLIPDYYTVRPFVSFGAYGFEFLSKTDLRDQYGNYYYYWSDGSIKDKAEGSANAQNANTLVRDYTYESDVREQNKDGFGKYRESAWAFPIGAGVIMKINDRVDLKLNYQYYITTTDYIDGISEKSLGDRKGNKRNDNFSYASIGIQYDLIAKKPKRKPKTNDTIDYNDPYMLALFHKDTDKDSIGDIDDACQGTPAGVKVDAKGCPLDGDTDGVPDFRDDELATVPGLGVNLKGVGLNDAYWQTWYDNYMNDSISGDKTTEYTGNIYAVAKKKSDRKDPYTVELVRYNGSIPSDELAFLLSIGDINSTTLEDGSTVVYTSGNYEKLGNAIKRRDEFREEGNKKAGVSMFKGRDVVQLPEDELESLLKNEIEDLLKMNVNDSLGASATATATTPDEAFNRNDIVYRVQLGAFRNKISTSVFGASTGVLELKTGENVYRYVTKGYATIEEAAATRADLVVQGYSDAFVTAYRGGRRIPMSETKATVEKNFTEDLNENKTFNSIDKSLVAFKIQLGPLKRKAQEAAMDQRVKDIKDVQKEIRGTGNIRYTTGNFPGLELAEEYRKTLEEKGFTDAFIIATFKGEVISMQEAMELLK